LKTNKTDKLIGDERFDECIYFKDDDVMCAVCLSIFLLNVRYQCTSIAFYFYAIKQKCNNVINIKIPEKIVEISNKK